MKTIFLFIALLSVSASLRAQSCLPEGFYAYSQSQIDSFTSNYPGCKQIEGNVVIHGNDITSLEDLSVITAIGGHLWIESNPNLYSLSGLDSLASVGGNIRITNTNLPDLTGLTSLSFVGSELMIQQNSHLKNLYGPVHLKSLASHLTIEFNDSLVDLTGLDSLQTVEGGIWIDNNYSLKDMKGLSGLSGINENLQINGNPTLTSLSGLASLLSIGSYLAVIDNPVLASLEGLDNVEPGSISGLYIQNNSSLSSCAVRSICGYLSSPSGIVDVRNNAEGCNSVMEIKNICDTLSVEIINSADGFEVVPNPAHDKITINMPGKGKISIMNIRGEVIMDVETTSSILTIDILNFPKGIYIVRFTDDKAVLAKKFVKQ